MSYEEVFTISEKQVPANLFIIACIEDCLANEK